MRLESRTVLEVEGGGKDNVAPHHARRLEKLVLQLAVANGLRRTREREGVRVKVSGIEFMLKGVGCRV